VRLRPIAVAAAAALLVAGCGGGGEPTDAVPSATRQPMATASRTATPSSTPAEAHAEDAPSPPADSAPTPTATPDSAPTPTATPTASASPASGESGPGGAGDEQGARVPVELTVKPDGTVTPSTVSVPAFLALDLVVHNETAGSVSAALEGGRPAGALEVGSGATGRRRLVGLRKGRYTVRMQGAGTATVIVGVEPGP